MGRADEPGRSRRPAGEADARGAPNLAVRVGLLLVSPGELFERLRERPVWLDALLLLVVLNVVGSLALPDDLLRQMAQSGLPADADPAALEGSLGFIRTSTLVGAVVFTPLWAVLVAGYLLVVYDVVLAGEAGFRRLFSAWAHALVVLALGGMLSLLLMIARGEIGAVLALHLLVPGLESGGWWYRFLRGLDIFGLWTAVLLAIAVSRVYPRRTVRAAAAFLIGTYAILKAVVASIPGLAGA